MTSLKREIQDNITFASLFYQPDDSNYYGDFLWTNFGPSLHTAMERSCTEEIDYFLSAGCDIEDVDCYGHTPLHIAVNNGFVEGVKKLLERGVNLNAKDSNGCNALHYAVLNGDYNLLELLIENGCDTNAEDINGLTPLHVAVKHKTSMVAELLVVKGCSVNVKDKDGNTPLHFAYKGKYWQREESLDFDDDKLLQRGKELKIPSPEILAGQRYCDSLCKLLVEYGANVNSKNNKGETPLHLVASRNRWFVCNLLLSKGADVNIKDHLKNTPLHRAAITRNSILVCESLIERGSDINAKNHKNQTPLHLAVKVKETEKLCQLLLAKGADVNTRDDNNRTPLHFAAMSNVDINSTCKVLLKNGAKVDARDNDKCTPLYYALKGGKSNISKLIIRNGADVNQTDCEGKFPLYHATEAEDCNLIALILSNGGDVNSKDISGKTVLHIAGQKCSSSLIQRFLVEGADVNAQSCYGDTPLHYVINQCIANEYKNKYKHSLKILLNWGACITTRNHDGLSCLDKAVNTAMHEDLMKHQIKINCMKVPGYIQNHVDLNDNQSVREECLKELDTMKLVNFGHSTLYDTFSNFNHPTVLDINKFEQIMRFPKFEDYFHYYLQLMKVSYFRLKKRMIMIDSAVKSSVIALPDKIVTQILSYLSDIDLQNMIKTNKMSSTSYWNNFKELFVLFCPEANFTSENADDSELYCYSHDEANALPLHEIIKTCCLETLQRCYTEGLTDLEVVDCCGRTPLALAVNCGFSTGIHFLLKSGAKVDARDAEGNSPLHTAVLEKNVEIIELLIDYQADVDIVSSNEKTPLHLAIQHGCVLAVELLLAKGCNVNYIDSTTGKYPIHFVFDLPLDSKFFYSILKLLITNGCKVNCVNRDGNTPLHLAAARKNSKSIIELLLLHGADVNVMNKENKTALNVAVSCGHYKVLKTLLTVGVSVNSRDEEGKTLLHYAVLNSRIVELLLANGGDVEVKDYSGKTVLHTAADRYCTKYGIRMILEKAKDINVQDDRGNTPLHYTVLSANANFFSLWSSDSYHIPVLRELSEWGASISIQNNDGEAPLLINEIMVVGPLFITTIIKQQCAHIYDGKPYTFESENYITIKESCLEELGRMKLRMFGNNSLYEVFSKYNNPTYVDNGILEKAIKSSTIESEFPNYFDLLDITFRKAKRRFALMNNAQRHLDISLPADLRRKILSYLDEIDLRNIIISNEDHLS